MFITEQDVVDICNKRVNVSKLTAKNATLCIDGTSCTKKSSILEATQQKVSKIQRVNGVRTTNTYFPSAIGYISVGVNNLKCGGARFEDRSPMNVLDWIVLWRIADDFLLKFGNVAITQTSKEMRQALSEYKELFAEYKNWYVYKMFSCDINTIALINSNTAVCDELRYSRNEGSDKQRSTWKFYTGLQNLMYEALYPGLIIDLAWFGVADADDVVSGIAIFLNSVLQTLATRPNLDHARLISRKLPSLKEDYTLLNATTHVYRSIGRWGAAVLMDQEEDLRFRIPGYLNVENIKHPRGNHDPPIVAHTRALLFDSEPILDDFCLGENSAGDDCSLDEMF